MVKPLVGFVNSYAVQYPTCSLDRFSSGCFNHEFRLELVLGADSAIVFVITWSPFHTIHYCLLNYNGFS